jgi:hypothetical protein
VTFELIKWVQAAFMMWDLEMTVENRFMVVKNSNLNDELCRVCFLFLSLSFSLPPSLSLSLVSHFILRI